MQALNQTILWQQPIKVKLIDFGLACPVTAIKPGVHVQTIWYRAPKVILNIPFNEANDMCSLGLVAIELTTGWPLYSGGTAYDVLCYINEIQGQPQDHVMDFGLSTPYYFVQQSQGEQRWIFKPQKFWEVLINHHATKKLQVTCLLSEP